MNFIIGFICVIAGMGIGFRFFKLQNEDDFIMGVCIGIISLLISHIILCFI